MLLTKKLLLAATIGCAVTTAFAAAPAAPVAAHKKAVSIAIVEPLQHEAMNEIIDGYRDGMKKAGFDAAISIKNGQLDPNIEKSIFKELASDKTQLVAPIGTTLFQMAAATVPSKPIIGIAVSDNSVSTAVRKQMNPIRATAISDSINPVDQLTFMHAVLPKMKKISLVYSADDNIISQVTDIVKVAKTFGIQVQKLMVTSAPDLYTISHHIDSDAGCIFILKDHMVVSAIPQLAQQAQALQIPLIASDDGSVQNGAAFAFGITERQIGEASAKVTAAYLNGTSMKNLPVKMLTDYRVFLNAPMAIKQGFTEKQITALQAIAKTNNYPIINCTPTSCKASNNT